VEQFVRNYAHKAEDMTFDKKFKRKNKVELTKATRFGKRIPI